MTDNEAVSTNEFKFKMDKVERYISIGVFIIFMLSFNTKYSSYWTILLFALSAVIFVYYFKWYKKKPSYLIIEEDQLIIHPPLFFKQRLIKKSEIEGVQISDKDIQINYTSGGIKSSIKIYSIILAEGDWKNLTGELNGFNR